MSEKQSNESPSWEAEMLRLHRRNGWKHGWGDAAVVLCIFAFLALMVIHG